MLLLAAESGFTSLVQYKYCLNSSLESQTPNKKPFQFAYTKGKGLLILIVQKKTISRNQLLCLEPLEFRLHFSLPQ